MVEHVTAEQATAERDVAQRSGRRTGLDRDDVIDAALDLVHREGPGALTMRRLATELEVGTPTIYWHVGSREELIVEVVRRQSLLFAEVAVVGATPRDCVLSAALHMYSGAVEQRSITSLAHQSGISSLLLGRLQAVLVAELDAAGLSDEALGDALRSILVVVTGALVVTLRDHAGDPHSDHPHDEHDAVWAESDLESMTARTLRAVIDHHLPA